MLADNLSCTLAYLLMQAGSSNSDNPANPEGLPDGAGQGTLAWTDGRMVSTKKDRQQKSHK